MKKNITISLTPEIAQWAKIEAARKYQSLSAFILELLSQKKNGVAEEESIMKRFFDRNSETIINNGNKKYPKRDELYDRD